MKLIQAIGAALLALLVVDGVAQGQETKKATQVSGTVTFNGKPLTGGVVVFHSGKGMRDTVMVGIGEDGKYAARKVKPGAGVKVTIDVECFEVLAKQETQRLMELEARAQLLKAAKKENADLDKQITEMKARLKTIDKVRKGLVKVPKKYTDVETTSLSVEVKDGEQTINIELKD